MDARVAFAGLGADPAAIRAALNSLSWSLFDSTLRSVPRGTLAAVIRVTAPGPEHDPH